MELLQKGKINIGFVDGQWGSSGKGKFNGTLALKEAPDFAISHNSVNASHIWEDRRGFRYKFQHLPSSVVNPTTAVIIGAGASISMPTLMREIEDWGLTPSRLFIHPTAVVITDADIKYEQYNLKRIASTMTGNGAATGRKIMREEGVKLARDMEQLKPFLQDTCAVIHVWLKLGKTGILETAQGFDLSMDHGMLYHTSETGLHSTYPYCTSRNVDPMTFAGMTGISHKLIGNVLLNLRTFPIRVGDGSNNKVDGLSGLSLAGSDAGSCYPDQMEMDWGEITKRSGSKIEIMERTSLTKRVRRVFSFSTMQLRCITRTVCPDFISLNFVNYIDAGIAGVRGTMSMNEIRQEFPRVADFIETVELSQYWAGTSNAAKVVWLGTGPAEHHIIELVR